MVKDGGLGHWFELRGGGGLLLAGPGESVLQRRCLFKITRKQGAVGCMVAASGDWGFGGFLERGLGASHGSRVLGPSPRADFPR